MAVYVVTWNLNREKPNYAAARAAFIAHLNRYSTVYDPGLETVRFVEATWTATQIQDDLKAKLDGNDRLFVSRLFPNEIGGFLSTEVGDWIKARL